MQKGSSAARSYSYLDSANKVLSLTNPTSTYTYDGDGNIKTSGSTGLTAVTYDPFTQLTMGMSAGSATASFEYGGAKQRVLKSVTSGANTVKTLYLHGLSNYPLTESISSNGEPSTATNYIYGPTGLIAICQNSQYYYAVKDHLGSIRVVLNGSDSLIAEWNDYLTFGGIAQNQVNPDVHYRYTSQEQDNHISSNLMNYRARFYDTELGRFYAVDPASEGFSPYEYAHNNPIRFVDPTGRVSEKWLMDQAIAKQLWEKGGHVLRPRWAVDAAYAGSMSENPFFGADYSGDLAEIAASLGLPPSPDGEHYDYRTTGWSIGIDYYDPECGCWVSEVLADPYEWVLVKDGAEMRTGHSINDVDPNTVGKNIWGTNWTGENNPLTYGGSPGYNVPPSDASDDPSYFHDLYYDKLKIEGSNGLWTSTEALPADVAFVYQEALVASDPNVNFLTRVQAAGDAIYVGMAVKEKFIRLQGDFGRFGR